MDSSLIGTAQQLVKHGLETSPTEGNGYGLALGTSIFISIVFALVIVWQERSKRQLAKEYVAFLQEAKQAAERRANSERKRNRD